MTEDDKDKKHNNDWTKNVECTNWPKNLKTPVQLFNEGAAWGQKQIIDQQVEIELRDRFAAAALTGLVQSKYSSTNSISIQMSEQVLAVNAYRYADAMLEARKK